MYHLHSGEGLIVPFKQGLLPFSHVYFNGPSKIFPLGLDTFIWTTIVVGECGSYFKCHKVTCEKLPRVSTIFIPFSIIPHSIILYISHIISLWVTICPIHYVSLYMG